ATAGWGYLRLRSPAYDAPGIRTWTDRILAQPWSEAFVYFKHEVFGPVYAEHLGALARGEPAPELPKAAAPAAPEPKPKPKAAKRATPIEKAAPRKTKKTR
ncbi:MAG TPA: hypothetical protein VGK73_14455, partial [Polyangiaceae bacterium]